MLSLDEPDRVEDESLMGPGLGWTSPDNISNVVSHEADNSDRLHSNCFVNFKLIFILFPIISRLYGCFVNSASFGDIIILECIENR